MRFFNVGIFVGIGCAISWVLFDIFVLPRIRFLGACSHWLKTSYRRSIVLDLAIIMGFFSVQARLLDMLNGFVAVCSTTLVVCSWNTLAVSFNKLRSVRS